MENLDTSKLARDGVHEFALILTHPKLRGATGAWTSPIALIYAVEHYDVIIIGSGAGGGTLAHRLAPSGKKILVLERGGYLARERENWDSEEVFARERYVTTERRYDRRGAAFRPHAQYFVGGNTKVYGGVLFRLGAGRL